MSRSPDQNCQEGEAPVQDEDEIRQSVMPWFAATNAGDADMILGLMAKVLTRDANMLVERPNK